MLLYFLRFDRILITRQVSLCDHLFPYSFYQRYFKDKHELWDKVLSFAILKNKSQAPVEILNWANFPKEVAKTLINWN